MIGRERGDEWFCRFDSGWQCLVVCVRWIFERLAQEYFSVYPPVELRRSVESAPEPEVEEGSGSQATEVPRVADAALAVVEVERLEQVENSEDPGRHRDEVEVDRLTREVEDEEAQEGRHGRRRAEVDPLVVVLLVLRGNEQPSQQCSQNVELEEGLRAEPHLDRSSEEEQSQHVETCARA